MSWLGRAFCTAFGEPKDKLREAISLRLRMTRGGDCFVARKSGLPDLRIILSISGIPEIDALFAMTN
jgi:hypothetical protein